MINSVTHSTGHINLICAYYPCDIPYEQYWFFYLMTLFSKFSLNFLYFAVRLIPFLYFLLYLKHDTVP